MYRLLFIDEQEEDINSFKDYIEEKDVEGNFQVQSLFPLESVEQMTQEIFSFHPDAVITDYMLNEYKDHVKNNIPYNGSQLVQAILSEREGFPCFVMTSFDDDAINESSDVNIVYIKGILHGTDKGTKAKATFLDRLYNQIRHYKHMIESSEARLIELLELSKIRNLDAPEEEEIIRLDSIVEKALDKKYTIPSRAKQTKESDGLIELLKMVDDLAKTLKHTGKHE